MELNYLEYLDLCDAMAIAIHRMRYYAQTDEKGRELYEDKEKRYQEMLRKLRHYAAENLY